MRMFRQGGFCVSLNPAARQLLLMAHGAWSSVDGALGVPAGIRVVHFYTVHGEYGKRASAYAVLAATTRDAYFGLVDPVREVQARSLVNLDGAQRVANYDLASLEGEDTVWNDHQAQRAPNWNADIDLMVLERHREAHLRDALAVARAARGQDYDVVHCCHCRYVAPA